MVPPAENGAFFVTTNVVITPNQTWGECPEVSNYLYSSWSKSKLSLASSWLQTLSTPFYITNITNKETILKKMFLILCEMNIEYNRTICHKTRTDPYLLTSQTSMTWWVLLWCVAFLGEGKVIFSGWELTEPSLLGVPSQTCAFFSVTFWKSKLRSWRIYCNFSQSTYLNFFYNHHNRWLCKKVSQV